MRALLSLRRQSSTSGARGNYCSSEDEIDDARPALFPTAQHRPRSKGGRKKSSRRATNSSTRQRRWKTARPLLFVVVI